MNFKHLELERDGAVATQRFARMLGAARAPIAMRAAKRAIRGGSETDLESGLLIEQDCFDQTMRSKDAARAMRALLEGESYTW